MRSFSVHRASISRYMSGRSAGLRRSSSGRNSYKLSGSTAFRKYLQDAQKLTDDINENDSTEVQETVRKSSALSKYARTQETKYTKDSGSRFNTGTDAMLNASDDITDELGKTDPDGEKLYAAAEKFIEGFNDMTAAVRNSSNSSVARKSDFINDVMRVYARSLEKVGVKSDMKGVLSIDKEKFLKADAGDVANIFANKGSFASHISEQTESIKKLSLYSADTYSGNTAKSAYSAYTSSMSGSLFSRKL